MKPSFCSLPSGLSIAIDRFVNDGHDPKDAFDLLGQASALEHMSSHYLENVVLRTSPAIDSAELRPRVERSLVLARAREKEAAGGCREDGRGRRLE